MAFAGPGQGSYVLVDEATAEVGIFDLDGPSGEILWKDYRNRFPARPTLVISMQIRTFENALLLSKPIKLDKLLMALEKLRASCRGREEMLKSSSQQPINPPYRGPTPEPSQGASPSLIPCSGVHQHLTFAAAETLGRQTTYEYCGDTPDQDVADPIQLEKIYYDPHRYLQGYLCTALTRAQATGGACIASGWGMITILPELSQAMLKLNDRQLRSLCVVPLVEADVEIHSLSSQELKIQGEQASTATPGQPLQPLLWKVALWTSRGRLPIGVPLDSPVRLQHWPNITRLLLTPYAMRIAALWTAQSHSLLETVTTLQIPQRYVFAFFSAAYSVGLVEPRFPARDAPLSTPVPLQKSVLGKVLSRVRKVNRSR